MTKRANIYIWPIFFFLWLFFDWMDRRQRLSNSLFLQAHIVDWERHVIHEWSDDSMCDAAISFESTCASSRQNNRIDFIIDKHRSISSLLFHSNSDGILGIWDGENADLMACLTATLPIIWLFCDASMHITRKIDWIYLLLWCALYMSDIALHSYICSCLLLSAIPIHSFLLYFLLSHQL